MIYLRTNNNHEQKVSVEHWNGPQRLYQSERGRKAGGVSPGDTLQSVIREKRCRQWSCSARSSEQLSSYILLYTYTSHALRSDTLIFKSQNPFRNLCHPAPTRTVPSSALDACVSLNVRSVFDSSPRPAPSTFPSAPCVSQTSSSEVRYLRNLIGHELTHPFAGAHLVL